MERVIYRGSDKPNARWEDDRRVLSTLWAAGGWEVSCDRAMLGWQTPGSPPVWSHQGQRPQALTATVSSLLARAMCTLLPSAPQAQPGPGAPHKSWWDLLNEGRLRSTLVNHPPRACIRTPTPSPQKPLFVPNHRSALAGAR